MRVLKNILSVRTVDVAMTGRDNNFNLLRFVAATMVIWSHSFALRSTQVATDPLGNILGFGFAGIAVNLFFAISGFLIVRSYLTHDSLRLFLQARALRIMPGLIVAVLFCALIVGPIFSKLPLEQYFGHESVWKFIHTNITFYQRHPTLVGVFTDNPKIGVNGSLWTLPYEVFMYLVVALLGISGILKQRYGITLVCVLYVIYYCFAFNFPDLAKERLSADTAEYMRLSLYFFLGGCFYVFRKRIPLNFVIVVGLWLLAVLAYKTQFFNLMFSFGLLYSTFFLGLVPKGAILRFNEIDDYSYGIYIYAFPVQQMLVEKTDAITAVQLFISAFLITLVFAWLSCKLVEKPALRLNSKLTKRYYRQLESRIAVTI